VFFGGAFVYDSAAVCSHREDEKMEHEEKEKYEGERVDVGWLHGIAVGNRNFWRFNRVESWKNLSLQGSFPQKSLNKSHEVQRNFESFSVFTSSTHSLPTTAKLLRSFVEKNSDTQKKRDENERDWNIGERQPPNVSDNRTQSVIAEA
jgi:hypothetical protein